MAISKYNHSLDFTVLALAAAANGDFSNAGKLLVKASKQHDVQRAVAILEASNQGAYDKVVASQKKAAKPAAKVGAAARIAAKTKVKAFDMGDESEITDLVDGDGEDFEEVVEEASLDEDEDDGDTDGADFDNAFASVLAGMKGGKPAKAK